MNTLDARITEVQSPIYDEKYHVYVVKIKYDCWGSESESEIWKEDFYEASKIKVGDIIYV